MKLEQTLEKDTKTQNRRFKDMYDLFDLECLGAIALYGNMDRGYDFISSGFQLHIHEDSKYGLTGANIKPYGEKYGYPIRNDQALISEVYAQRLGFPKIDMGSSS
ncbi:MAG: hypothetical protein U9Q69_06310 [Nanoarchaeota archaeon]|nr:hypothetical protein [Nanoarchaeota archaeon]